MSRPRHRSRPHRALAACLLLAVLVPVVVADGSPTADGTVAASRGPDGDQDQRGLPPVLPSTDDGFRPHPDLADLEVDGPAYRRVRAEYDETASALDLARLGRVEALTQLSDLAAQRRRIQAEMATAAARRDAASQRVDELDGAIGELAVESFIHRDLSSVSLADDPALANEADRRRVITGAVVDSLLAQRAVSAAELERARTRLEDAHGRDRAIAAEEELARAALDEAREAEAGHAFALGPRREELEQAAALATVEGVDFPLVALDAYYRSAMANAQTAPACGLEWWGLAGISRVEGRHGSYGGARLEPSGDTTRPIIGIPLTGENDTALVQDTDGGALDGDPNIDRAVGPMQFIPETWRRFARDGNEDDVEDPHNLYDATSTAAAYLCRASGGLSDDPGLRRAYFAYNHSEAYVENVLGHARRYRQRLGDLGADGG